MELVFDDKGNLQPYTPIIADLETLESVFAVSEHRKVLFEVYLQYVEELKALLAVPFVQWVNGSYVTKKDNPQDIDVLTFIDYETFKKKAKELKRYNDRIFWKPQGIDCYLLESFPSTHKQYFLCEMDRKQWLFDFSRKLNPKTGKHQPKGFLELNF